MQIVSPDVQPGLLVVTKSQTMVRTIPEVEVRVPGMNSASESSLRLGTFSEQTPPSKNLRKWDKRIQITR